MSENKMAKQAGDFKIEKENCYAVIAGIERDLRQFQKLNQVAERTLEEKAEQIGRLLQEKVLLGKGYGQS